MQHASPRSPLESALARIVTLEPGEAPRLAASFLAFLCVLCAYYVIRPVRDEMGVTVGSAALPQLFTVVLVVMLLAVPVFGWVVAHFPRRRVLPVVYTFFMADLVVFWLLLRSGWNGPAVAATFFVWASVFNLFVVSMFWCVMADTWRLDQAKRVYGAIAAGGSTGALIGPVIASFLVTRIGPEQLLLISALLLGLAMVAALSAHPDRPGAAGHAKSEADADSAAGLLDGALQVWRSPLLWRIAFWVFIANVVGTLFYLEQARIVGGAIADRTARVHLFASVDLAVNVTTLLAQLLLVNAVLSRYGAAVGALALPIWALLGLAAISLSPVLWVVIVVLAGERILAFAFASPSLKALFTTVPPSDKFTAQNFIDTVVFRAGDAMSGWLFSGLGSLLGLGAAGLAAVTLPAAVLWIGIGAGLSGLVAKQADAP